RFAQYAEWVEQGKLFTEQQPAEWLCLNCGHVHRGTGAPAVCPVCSHDQGYFIRALHP
ncbi:MAG: rubrerythrin family protein, partial [Clostridiales bacterium]|nr:rubrerythrin family protein [Clostridiales bacterium]